LNKKLLYYVFVISIILVVISFGSIELIKASNTKTPNTYCKAITLKDAYNIAAKEAIKWNIMAKLYSITSTDVPDKEEKSYGTDGKRSFWNLDFSMPNTNDHYIISIQNGQVYSKTKTKGINKTEKLIENEEIIFDSPELLKTAVIIYKIKTGTSWAIGYHFELNKNDKIPMIGVVGWDAEGNFSKIFFNAKTGKLIDGYHKMPIGGGFYSIHSNEPIFEDKSLNILGSDIYKEDSSNRMFIIWGISESTQSQFIKISQNNGTRWNELNRNLHL
jgi:hypothetical protein